MKTGLVNTTHKSQSKQKCSKAAQDNQNGQFVKINELGNLAKKHGTTHTLQTISEVERNIFKAPVQ